MTYPEGLQRVKVVNDRHAYYITIDGKPFGGDYMSASALDEIRLFLAENVNELFPTPFDFKQLQTEVDTWATHNFDKRTQVHPLIGICEEVGELCAAYIQSYTSTNRFLLSELTPNMWIICAFAHMGKIAHAHLKAATKIKGTQAEHDATKVDGLNMLLTSLRFYFGSSTLSDAFDSYGLEYIDSNQTVMQFDVDTTADAVADTIVFISDFCNASGIDMQEAVEITWAKVKQRDFRLYPDTGIPPIVHIEQTDATVSTSEQTTGIQKHNENIYKR